MDVGLLVMGILVVATSAISGVLGMAGGMILMGAYGWVLPVGTAMVLHGVTQAASNGFRALILARHVRLRLLLPYAGGAAGAVAIFTALDLALPRGWLFLALGLMPFAAPLLRRAPGSDVTRTLPAVACGLSVTSLHLLAGVSGPLLDLFFLRCTLLRQEIVATKAVSQVLGHVLKIVYFTRAAEGLGSPAVLGPASCAVAIVAALVGTWLGTRLLGRLDERRFRALSGGVLRAMGVVYLAKAAWGARLGGIMFDPAMRTTDLRGTSPSR